MRPHPSEKPAKGSWEAERRHFDDLAREILRIQKRYASKSPAAGLRRAFQAKTRLGVSGARLEIRKDVPADLQVGYYRPGTSYEASVRISNANGEIRSDLERDMRSIAVRVKVSDTEYHDLLMTNGPVNHARDAAQMVAFAKAMAGTKLLIVPRLILGLGPFETIRMFRNLSAVTSRKVRSLALETYWSRAAMMWGPDRPARFFLRPAENAPTAPEPGGDDPEYLRGELADRLRGGDVVFDLMAQRYLDDKRTSIENGAAEWKETDSTPVPVARLVIPKFDIDSPEGLADEQAVDKLAFNPWNTTEDFRPLGNLNRARKAIYLASSEHRLGHVFLTEEPLRNRIFGGLSRAFFNLLNRFIPWHKLPTPIALLNLAGFRHVLRRDNLHDTEQRDSPPRTEPIPKSTPEHVRFARVPEGTHNDLSDPKMGAAGATFGRNFPLDRTVPRSELFDAPDPIVVSRELLTRESFIPAKSLNVLAAAWIQFQVHDWVDHPRHRLGRPGAKALELPLPAGPAWRNVVGGPEERVMRVFENIEKTPADPAAGKPPTFENTGSHWWDASQLYGRTLDETRRLRARDGDRLLAELALENGFLPEDHDPALNGARGIEQTGFNDNWWLGLSVLHTLFAREHNAVCAELRREYRWDEDRIYNTARLVIAALIAKIHTIEWTPAILFTKTIDVGLNANWSGAPKDWLSRLGVWLTDEHSLKGIPETKPDHHSAPYSLTEEFVTVYRLHPLLPDDYLLCRRDTGEVIRKATFNDIQARNTMGAMRDLGMRDALYSLGIAYPGAITLHNYPNSLRQFERLDGERLDLAVVDLVRERRRGVPRYNDFRELLHKPRIRRWEELTSNAESIRKLRAVYGDDGIDRVDTMVGLLGETPPEGFGFSDTAFRIFILMASRRLQSDRFFTVDFRPEVYSPLGMDWVAKNGMKSVVSRHFPELDSVMPSSLSAFAPWSAVGS